MVDQDFEEAVKLILILERIEMTITTKVDNNIINTETCYICHRNVIEYLMTSKFCSSVNHLERFFGRKARNGLKMMGGIESVAIALSGRYIVDIVDCSDLVNGKCYLPWPHAPHSPMSI